LRSTGLVLSLCCGRTMRVGFASSLGGVGDDDIASRVCPIGITQIRDKAPAASALAVAAQLLIRRDAIAAAVPSPEHAEIS
jgi:xanthine/CO dehydrogenase XdhC/CoxF family maturation factor